MDRRTFLKSAFIFTAGLWVPKTGILRPAQARMNLAVVGGGVPVAGANIQWVNTAIGSGEGALNNVATVTASITVTAGNMLVAFVFPGDVVSVVDDASTGNTFGLAVQNSGQTTSIWYKENALGDTNVITTATWGSTKTYRRIVVAQFSGIATASSIDQTNSKNNTVSQAVEIGPITTTVADEVILVGVCRYNGATYTQGTGYTKLDSPVTDVHVEYIIVSSAGSKNGDMTLNTSDTWRGAMASFKAA